jgi:hypothetical protein
LASDETAQLLHSQKACLGRAETASKVMEFEIGRKLTPWMKLQTRRQTDVFSKSNQLDSLSFALCVLSLLAMSFVTEKTRTSCTLQNNSIK